MWRPRDFPTENEGFVVLSSEKGQSLLAGKRDQVFAGPNNNVGISHTVEPIVA